MAATNNCATLRVERAAGDVEASIWVMPGIILKGARGAKSKVVGSFVFTWQSIATALAVLAGRRLRPVARLFEVDFS